MVFSKIMLLGKICSFWSQLPTLLGGVGVITVPHYCLLGNLGTSSPQLFEESVLVRHSEVTHTLTLTALKAMTGVSIFFFPFLQ